MISCSCEPEQIAHYAFKGMEALIGQGVLPSEEIRQLGKFEGMNVSINQSSEKGAFIQLKLTNGDPTLLGGQREILARKCAEIYLRDFENSKKFDSILIQFIQIDSSNPENIAMEEYEFQIKDFNLQDP